MLIKKMMTSFRHWLPMSLAILMLLTNGLPVAAQEQADTDTPASYQLYLPLINQEATASFDLTEEVDATDSPALPTDDPAALESVNAATLTGWKLPGANAVVPGGDNNGFESFPAYAYGANEPNGQLAGDWSSGSCTAFPCSDSKRDQHRFSAFNFALPANATIQGLQVRLDAKAARTNNSACTTPQIGVRLSKDGGSTWTGYKYATIASSTWPPSTHYVGAVTDKWGTTWTSSSFANPNFQVQLINKANNTDCSFYLDALQAQVNYNATVLPTLTINNGFATESGGVLSFHIMLSAPTGQNVTFTYATANGTANAGADYTAQSGVKSIPAGSTITAISVPLLDDALAEGNETFALILSNPSSNVTIGTGQGVGTILDDDTDIAMPTLQHQPTGDYTLPTAKKAALPPANSRGEGFGEWPNAHLSAACIESHDRYWVYGPDNRAYHTWHPVTETITLSNGQQAGCEYGHEHGSNPALSPAFGFFGGWPPFGYVMQQQPEPQGHPQHRHEDHVGHKVNVATFRAAFGKPQEAGTPLYDAGFNCHFISKLHQGTWSRDALPNHVHEYYLAVACNDRFMPDTGRPSTWFSVRRMAVFGSPNTFKKICPTYTEQPLDNLLDFDGVVIPATTVTTPAGSGNREFQCFHTDLKDKHPTQLAQPELWTGLNTINTGTGSLFFAPYYIIKNPARLYDGAAPHRVRRTIDYCYAANGAAQYLSGYCSGAPAQKPAWDSAASPFKGTLRAVNFKEMQLYNLGGHQEICTDVFGAFMHVATATTPCNYQAGEIYQAVSPTHNEWTSGLYCYNGRCGEIHGSLENALPDPQPGDPQRFKAPGIGFEHLEFHDHPSVRGQN